MKAEWTLANHPEIKGLNACAEKVLDILRLDIGPTVRVKGGKWEATVFVAKFDSRCRIEVSDRSPHVWFRDVAMPTTAEELPPEHITPHAVRLGEAYLERWRKP